MNCTSQKLLIFLAFFVVAIWGETFVSTKVLLGEGLHAADIFLYRFIIAYIGLIILSHKQMWTSSLWHETLMILAGITGGSLYFLFENFALKYSTASNVAIIVGTTPMVTALIYACFYKENRMNAKQLLGSIIAFIGLTMVVLNGQLVLNLNPLGDALAMGASIIWAAYSVMIKPLSFNYDVCFITRKIFGYGLITIVPWFIFVEEPNFNLEVLMRPVVWGNIVYLAIVASLLCFILWNWVLPRLGVVKATNIIYTQCVFTMIISVMVLNERITWMAIAGTAILIFGMLMLNRGDKKVRID